MCEGWCSLRISGGERRVKLDDRNYNGGRIISSRTSLFTWEIQPKENCLGFLNSISYASTQSRRECLGFHWNVSASFVILGQVLLRIKLTFHVRSHVAVPFTCDKNDALVSERFLIQSTLHPLPSRFHCYCVCMLLLFAVPPLGSNLQSHPHEIINLIIFPPVRANILYLPSF